MLSIMDETAVKTMRWLSRYQGWGYKRLSATFGVSVSAARNVVLRRTFKGIRGYHRWSASDKSAVELRLVGLGMRGPNVLRRGAIRRGGRSKARKEGSLDRAPIPGNGSG